MCSSCALLILAFYNFSLFCSTSQLCDSQRTDSTIASLPDLGSLAPEFPTEIKQSDQEIGKALPETKRYVDSIGQKKILSKILCEPFLGYHYFM